MAEVTGPATIPSVAHADRDNRPPAGDRHPSSDSDDADEADSKKQRRVRDVTLIMGIPPEEMTPSVQEALTIIVGEFDRIRGEYERARDRLIHLQSQLDRHSFLAALSRPALTRELGRVLDRCRRAETTSTLVCLHFGNLGGVRRVEGRAVAERALAAGVDAVTGRLRSTDVAGSLGGADIGVVLSLTGGDAALEKARELAVAAQARVDGLNLGASIRVAWGMHEFGTEATAEQILDAGDRDLWRRSDEV